MSARTLLQRQGALVSFVWLSLGAGLAVALAAFALVRFEAWPVALRPLVQARAIADTVWTTPWSERAVTPASSQAESVAALVGLLLGLAATVAGVALVNVAAMVAGRRLRLRRETAIRAAIGASPLRLRGERALEGGLLYGGGLVLAGLVAAGLITGLRRSWPMGLDSPPAAIGSGTVAAGVAIGLLLLLLTFARGLRGRELRSALAGGSATADLAARRQYALPVIAQIMLALTLASTAGLLLRYARSEPAGSGIAADGFAALEVTANVSTPRERAAAFGGFLAKVHALPGVHAESLASPGAWLGIGVRDRVIVECGTCYRALMLMTLQPANVVHHAVSPGFFAAVKVPVIEGRAFNASDTFDSARVAMVNETFARRSFENGNPLGRRVQLGGTNGEWYTVIGVVRDIRARGIGAPRTALPALYLSTQQVPPFTVDVAVRTELEPAAVAERVQAATREMPIAPPRDATTLNERLERALAPLRWFGALFALLALTAIALAVHGVHTLAHAWVAARRRELAIRAAIGATPFRLLRLVLTGITRIAAIGLALGVVAAWCAGRALQLRIAGLPPLDLSTAAPLAAALCLAALAGALWAAIRVVRSAPATAFRDLTQG